MIVVVSDLGHFILGLESRERPAEPSGVLSEVLRAPAPGFLVLVLGGTWSCAEPEPSFLPPRV